MSSNILPEKCKLTGNYHPLRGSCWRVFYPGRLIEVLKFLYLKTWASFLTSQMEIVFPGRLSFLCFYRLCLTYLNIARQEIWSFKKLKILRNDLVWFHSPVLLRDHLSFNISWMSFGKKLNFPQFTDNFSDRPHSFLWLALKIDKSPASKGSREVANLICIKFKKCGLAKFNNNGCTEEYVNFHPKACFKSMKTKTCKRTDCKLIYG